MHVSHTVDLRWLMVDYAGRIGYLFGYVSCMFGIYMYKYELRSWNNQLHVQVYVVVDKEVECLP